MRALILFGPGGALFGFGLGFSGMTRPEVVLSFLLFEDFGLMLVMGGAVLVTLPVYQFVRKTARGDAPESFRAWLNPKTSIGAVLFGLGWGLSGVCPGAALASVGTGNWPVLVAVVAMFAGGLVEGLLRHSASPSGSAAATEVPPPSA